MSQKQTVVGFLRTLGIQMTPTQEESVTYYTQMRRYESQSHGMTDVPANVRESLVGWQIDALDYNKQKIRVAEIAKRLRMKPQQIRAFFQKHGVAIQNRTKSPRNLAERVEGSYRPTVAA